MAGQDYTGRRSQSPEPIESLAVLVPVYNSEGTIGRLVDTVVETIGDAVDWFEIILVNDGSRDDSESEILAAIDRHPGMVGYVRLARNFGEHNAVMCGLHHVAADAVVIIDDDFQNPPSEILKLVDKLREGYDAVYSRYETKHHAWYRNLGSGFNNWVAGKLIGKPRALYLSSFKAMNRFLIDTITDYDGPYPYIDGLILRSTDSIATELCAHQPREDGRSNYTLTRLVLLWLNMFTSFSVVPLRVSTLLGFATAAFGLLLGVFYIISWSVGGVFQDAFPPGWASTIVSICIFSGIQLSVMGMIGEYLGRMFMTQNRQPQFVVRKVVGIEDEDDD